MKFIVPVIVGACWALGVPTAAQDARHTPIFISGQGGYHTYRIPSLITTGKGTLLAFCEARKHNAADHGDIDLVVRRSSDHGKTWTPMKILGDDGEHTMGNPCPVLDRKTGTIVLPFCRDNKQVFVMCSKDDGVTWSEPVEISKDVMKANWTWVATGPGVGIQTKNGRLVIPCDHQDAAVKSRLSHVITSDDGGATWKLGGMVGPLCNECQIVELTNGSLMINMRSYRGTNCRQVAISKDGGASFLDPKEDGTLIEPICQASLIRLPGAAGGLLFSNPASTRREKLTVRLSRDEGRTWPIAKVLHPGPAAYSCLAALDDGTIGCLYERGDKKPYETITLARFTREWLAHDSNSALNSKHRLGYTELQTNLPGGRHANVRTMRAVVARRDGTERTLLAPELANDPDSWTQFAGWSPDGTAAIVARGWQSLDNARWEEEHKQFRFTKEAWLLDSYLVDLATGKATNVTAVERVSHYNGGLFFLPGGRGLGFTPLIGGVSKPYVMDLDGRNKRDVSGQGGGFAYGYSASPDGKRISYHDNYQVFVANADGSNKQHVKTGNSFNFGPRWSANGEWLLFLSGVHGRSNPFIVRRDGTGLRKLADLGGYQGWVAFLDVPDFHDGSSDLPAWSTDGACVFYTARVGNNVELFQTTLDGTTRRLTSTANGSIHYHPQPSPDGQWLAYGSKRDGVRQLFVMNLTNHAEVRATNLKQGQGAMWPHWQPAREQR